MPVRIISGRLKGRKLAAVRGLKTRPTADRVRESLFSILGQRVSQKNVLDLFAGTGALGLEALSRGAAQAVFIDKADQALAVLQKNVRHCGMQDHARIIRWDIEKNLNCLKIYPQVFGLIFMDPPYGQQLIKTALHHLSASGCVAPDALLVIETSKAETLADLSADSICNDERTYGNTRLWFLNLKAA